MAIAGPFGPQTYSAVEATTVEATRRVTAAALGTIHLAVAASPGSQPAVGSAWLLPSVTVHCSAIPAARSAQNQPDLVATQTSSPPVVFVQTEIDPMAWS